MSSKRRSGPAGSPAGFASTPEAKRRKRNDGTHFPDIETAQITTENGLKLIQLLKVQQDKSGRDVAIHFIDLPSKKDYPDYYQQTAMPISLNIIEKRLKNGDYENMERLESDIKRMIQNAKEYNTSGSEIFDDAERLRKTLSNFMPKYNPAYLNSDYRSYPTPIPQALLERKRESSASTAGTNGLEKVKLVFSNSAAKRRKSQSTPANDEPENGVDYKAAMLDLMEELLVQEDAINFETKPPRKDYPDYYKIIEKPTSISDVKLMIARDKMADWDALAKEVRLIWENAKEYNETGSVIYEMAETLESWFEEKVQALGAHPRIIPRLSLSQPKQKQLKLTIGNLTPTPNVNGGTIDGESLRRQKEEMGQALSRASRASTRSAHVNGSTPIPMTAKSSTRRSSSAMETSDSPNSNMNVSASSASNIIPAAAPTPTLPQIRQLPTPVMDGEPSTSNMTISSNHAPREATNPNSQSSGRLPYLESFNPIERKYRDPGKGLEDALLSSVTYMTNPNDSNDPKWKLIRYASATRTQTSYYVYLPLNHYQLRIIPTLSKELRSRRSHKLCVAHNWHVLQQTEQNTGVYDIHLVPGENAIVVDVIAELKNGERKDYAPPQLQLDFERVSFYIFLANRADV